MSIQDLTPEQLYELQQAVADPVRFTQSTGTVNGKPFSFEGRQHLDAIYKDEHPRIVIVASRQVEKTETASRKLIHIGYSRPYTTLTYTAPRAEQVSRFQSERFRGAIKDSTSEILENSVEKKRDAKTATGLTNKSIFYFGSAWSDGDSLRGIPADIVFFDEVQDITQTAIESIEKSVSHSEIQDPETELNGRCYYTGTPKETGSYYQRVLWNMSDQKKWHVTCKHCEQVQILNMRNLMDDPNQEKRKMFGCINCFEELDRSNGEWLPTKPDNHLYSGYHLSQLNMSWISANQIYRDYQTMDEMTFYNEVLGEFYAGNTKPVTIEDVLACTDKRRGVQTSAGHETVMGIDYGSGGHSKTIITIGHYEVIESVSKLVVDYIELCKITDHEKLIEHISQLKSRFNCVKINGDIGYGSYEHSKLHQWYGREAMANRYVSYPGNPAKREIKDKNILHVDRTHSMDKLIDMFKKKQLVLPYKVPNEIEWAFDHYTAIEMKFSESQSQVSRKMYDHRIPDDAFHSLNYVREGLYELENKFEWEGVERDKSMEELFALDLPEDW